MQPADTSKKEMFGTGTPVSSYALSADGKVLRKTSHVVMEPGTFDTKTVYDKQ
jgi:hypothetical protein